MSFRNQLRLLGADLEPPITYCFQRWELLDAC